MDRELRTEDCAASGLTTIAESRLIEDGGLLRTIEDRTSSNRPEPSINRYSAIVVSPEAAQSSVLSPQSGEERLGLCGSLIPT